MGFSLTMEKRGPYSVDGSSWAKSTGTQVAGTSQYAKKKKKRLTEAAEEGWMDGKMHASLGS